MRAAIIALVIAGLGGSSLATPASASVHVTVSGTALDAKSHASRVRATFAHKVQLANLTSSTFDLSVSERMATVSRREIEITVHLCVTISDRSGRMTSIVRSAASAKGSVKSIATLREEATAGAIDAAIKRARAAR